MKRKYFALFAAASLVAGAMTVRAQGQTGNVSSSDDQSRAQQQTAAVEGRGAAGQQQSPYAEDVRRVLARVTEQAVKGDTNDVADYFTTNSKDQFSRHGKHATETGPNATANDDQAVKDAKAADDQLKDTAKQFADAWKAKYGHAFNLDRKNEPLVYSGDTFQIMQGDVGNQQPRPAAGEVGPSGAGLDASHAANRDLSTNASVNGPTGTSANDTGVSGSARVGDTTVGGTAGTSGVHVDHDRNSAAPNMDKRMATVMVKESHGAPALTLTLVNEGTFGNRWHIQPPPGLDYKTLSMNLNKHLQEVIGMKDQWPQDENEAIKSVSHHMLAAIAMPMEKQAGAQQPDVNSAQPAGQLQRPGDQSSQPLPPPQQPQQQQNQPSR